MERALGSSTRCGSVALAICGLLAVVAGCPGGPPVPSGPTIYLSPMSLQFSGTEMGANPQDQTIQLSNTGIGTLDWSVSDDADWLFVGPAAGSVTTGTADLVVSVDTTGLTAAESPYNAHITVSAADATNDLQTVDVTLVLSELLCESLSGAITTDTTLSASCYNVESSISVSDGATLTIDPGVVIRFGSGHEMTVWDDGRLSAVGTATEPIVLRGMEAMRGYWGGLRFYHSNSTQNRLEYVAIAHGGGYWDANLVLDGASAAPARVSVTNCTLTDSETYGFYFNENAAVGDFGGNIVTNNTLGAGYISAAVGGLLDDTTTYTGNNVDQVRMWGATVETDQTWPGIDADYLIGGTVGVSAMLTIEPGARLVFGSGVEMTVWDDGQLAAVGTEADPIVLTGAEQTPGYWGGLRFYHSNSESNRLQSVTIEYGGGYWDANLLLNGGSASPVLLDDTDCTFQNSGTWGVYMNRYVTVNADLETANTFFGNVSGDVFEEP